MVKTRTGDGQADEGADSNDEETVDEDPTRCLTGLVTYEKEEV